jgi:hypothetical protein
MLSLAIAALLAAAPTRAITPNCFFNVTLSDNSPLLHYDPPNAWTSLFVNSPIGSWQPGIMGQGVSSHATYGTAPKITVEYAGTVAWAKGGYDNASATPINFVIDNQKQPFPTTEQGVFLSSSNDIPQGAHTAEISLDPSSTDPLAWVFLMVFQSICGVVAET